MQYTYSYTSLNIEIEDEKAHLVQSEEDVPRVIHEKKIVQIILKDENRNHEFLVEGENQVIYVIYIREERNRRLWKGNLIPKET